MAKISLTINDQAPIIMAVDAPNSHLSASFGMYDDEKHTMTLFADGYFSTPDASTHIHWTEHLPLTESDTVMVKLVPDDTPTTEPHQVRVSPKRAFPVNDAQADSLLAIFDGFTKQLKAFTEQQKSDMDDSEYDELVRTIRYYSWRISEEVHRDVFTKFPEKREQHQLVKQFRQKGITSVPAFLSPKDLKRLHQAVADFPNNTRQIAQKSEDIFAFAHFHDIRRVVSLLLSEDAQLVRSILFDKNEENNWLVPWHQDRTIAVTLEDETCKIEGWTGWTVKEGVTHVQPDLSVLERIVTLRIHLDDTPEDNACLHAIEGSHRHDLLDYDDVLAQAEQNDAIPYPVNAGDLIIMHPLTIHASHKSEQPTHRRVLHLEFSDAELPEGIDWA